MKETPQILQEIQKAKHILLHCHPSPDPDSVGSTLATKLGLEQLGKTVTLIAGDSEIPKAFAFPGVESIVPKSFDQINPGDFDLFIILDSGSPEMITRKIPVVFPETMMSIVIDHHASNKGYGKINLVDTGYAAVGEILFDLFKGLGITLNHDIALNLLMGIYADTGGFRYDNTRPNTFVAAAALATLAPDYSKTIAIMENSNRKEALIFEGLALSSVKTFYEGKLAISAISHEELVKNNIQEEDILTGLISNKLKSVIGTEVAATVVEMEKGISKASFRTRDARKFDVSRLAVALGGGGHIAAAGANLAMSAEAACAAIAEKAKELYNL